MYHVQGAEEWMYLGEFMMMHTGYMTLLNDVVGVQVCMKSLEFRYG
jgi:hypothetical protein